MKTHFLLTVTCVLLAVSFGSSTTAKADWKDRLKFSGFGSATAQVTDEQAYFNGNASTSGINKDGSFQETKLGLNVSAVLTDRLNIACQFFGEDSEDYNVHVDWAFANVKVTDQLSIRAGKVKYPVGLVNEYRDVGYAYPWLVTPYVIYTELGTENAKNTTPTAPSVTREAFTGASALWDLDLDDWQLSTNLFGGIVHLESSDVKKLIGLTLNLDWDDTILFTGSAYTGEMQNVPAFITDESTGATIANPMTAMNGKQHTVFLVGVKADWHDFILYSEAAHVTMEELDVMSSTVWYLTIGHRFGKWLPTLTHQEYENEAVRGGGQYTKYKIDSIGLRYDIMQSMDIKVDIARIDNEDGNGLFSGVVEKSGGIMKYGLGIDYVF